jgi:hypothetical protein
VEGLKPIRFNIRSDRRAPITANGFRGVKRGHGSDQESMRDACWIEDRNILARDKRMPPEQKACLVVVIARNIIVKYPAARLSTTRLVHQHTGFVILTSEKMTNGARSTVFLPSRNVVGRSALHG